MSWILVLMKEATCAVWDFRIAVGQRLERARNGPSFSMGEFIVVVL